MTADPGSGVRGALGRGARSSFAVQVAAVAVALGVQLVLIRQLGVERYGIYAYAASWLAALGLLARLGLDSASIRFVAVYAGNRDWPRLRGLLRRAPIWVLAAGLGLGGALAVGGRLASGSAGELTASLAAAGLAVPLLAILGLRQAALRGLGRVARAQAPEMLVTPVLLVLLSTAVWASMPARLTGAGAVLLQAIALGGALVVTETWLRRHLPADAATASPSGWQREWHVTALPLLFISGVAMVLAKTDVLMLGAWAGTTVAGNYVVAARLARLVLFGLLAATSIAAPLIAQAYARGDRASLHAIARHSALGILLFTVPVAAALVLLGPWLLALFDPSFVAGKTALGLLVAGHTINALAGSVSFFLTMTGHQMEAARLTALAAVVNVGLNAFLIPRYGMAGAAAATAFSVALLNLLLAWAVRRHLGIDPTVAVLLPFRARPDGDREPR